MKLFIKSMLIRALHTFAQTALGLIIVGQTLVDIDWLYVGSVAAVAAIISILKSITLGLPEVSGVDIEPEDDDDG